VPGVDPHNGVYEYFRANINKIRAAMGAGRPPCAVPISPARPPIPRNYGAADVCGVDCTEAALIRPCHHLGQSDSDFTMVHIRQMISVVYGGRFSRLRPIDDLARMYRQRRLPMSPPGPYINIVCRLHRLAASVVRSLEVRAQGALPWLKSGGSQATYGHTAQVAADNLTDAPVWRSMRRGPFKATVQRNCTTAPTSWQGQANHPSKGGGPLASCQ
jgi:hypothetical protein